MIELMRNAFDLSKYELDEEVTEEHIESYLWAIEERYSARLSHYYSQASMFGKMTRRKLERLHKGVIFSLIKEGK